ncbi:MAG: hypothetical protein PUD14_02340 [Prevotellaceae bacterium]|nr:hypothetical protein [Prevotellaceae bacterium]
MEGSIQKVLDTREDGMKCVRFESGKVGVVDERGEVIYQIDKCRHIEFAEHDFVKLKFGVVEILHNPTLKNAPTDDERYLRSVFYVDLRSGQMYGSMPQVLHRKEFELLYIGGVLCTRTRKCYMQKRKPDLIEVSPNGLYLPLDCFNLPDDERLNDVFRWYNVYEVCLLKDDDSKVYWLLRKYKDDSVLVMDENGLHIYVWMDWKTGKVTRQELGYMRNGTEQSIMTLMLNDIKRESVNRYIEKKTAEKREEERIREKEMKSMTSVEPIKIGGKWGLRSNGRMVVPPMYRNILTPVGKYCAVESCPGIWGVIAIDGTVEIEPRYEGVVIRPDGTVVLTIYGRKTVVKKLP